MLTDTSIAGASRGLIVQDLLAGKVHDVTLQVAVYAASNAAAQDVPHALGELAYAARELAENGAFPLRRPGAHGLAPARRAASPTPCSMTSTRRTSTRSKTNSFAGRAPSRATSNCDGCCSTATPTSSRASAPSQALLGDKVDAVTLALARFVIAGGRARDVVGTLDYLVDYVAKARDWRVARVHTARPLDEQSRADLVASLSALTGKNVELQVADSPELLGGVLVEIGDLRLDATTRARLGALRDAVSPGHLYESSLNRND